MPRTAAAITRRANRICSPAGSIWEKARNAPRLRTATGSRRTKSPAIKWTGAALARRPALTRLGTPCGGTGVSRRPISPQRRRDKRRESQIRFLSGNPDRGAAFQAAMPPFVGACLLSGFPAHSTPRAAGLRVLVAEDNLINQKVIGAMLRRQGWSVTLAVNGVEACRYFLENRSEEHTSELQSLRHLV